MNLTLVETDPAEVQNELQNVNRKKNPTLCRSSVLEVLYRRS